MPIEEIKQLTERLQVLEWMFYQWQDKIFPRQVPVGLFRVPSGPQKPIMYFLDIQKDLSRMQSSKEMAVMTYLAQQIRQKINVLVYLFQTQPNKQRLDRNITPSAFLTRKQWLNELVQKQIYLQKQQQSLEKLYEQALLAKNKENAAQIKSSLDEIEQHLRELKAMT